MWPLKRKKISPKPQWSGPSCSFCHGNHTVALAPYDTVPPKEVKIWRGQRYWICRCLSCGQNFYAEEPAEGVASTGALSDLIEDEAELLAAEDEVKRQAEDNGDRRCR